jgi:serine/threonine protein kinase
LDPKKGDKYGQYELIELIGRGGMAQVYRARQISSGGLVAMKIIRSEMANPESIERFNREAKITASLSHPNIVKVYESGMHEDLPFFVMEVLSGHSIADEIMQGVLLPKRAGRILNQVASALDYAHERGIIHRDLKPHNILLDDTGNAILSDFGMGKPMFDAETFTNIGTVLGTPEYISPEQVRSEPVDARTDIYALGVTMFEMLAGKLPFDVASHSHVVIMNMHINKNPPLLSSIRPELIMLDSAVSKAIEKKPQDRYNSAGEFAAAFNTARHQGPPQKSKPVPETVVDLKPAKAVPHVQPSANSAAPPVTSVAALVGAVAVVIFIAIVVVILLSH